MLITRNRYKDFVAFVCLSAFLNLISMKARLTVEDDKGKEQLNLSPNCLKVFMTQKLESAKLKFLDKVNLGFYPQLFHVTEPRVNVCSFSAIPIGQHLKYSPLIG